MVGQRRRALRLTLQQLADRVGCAKSYLWLIEHERRSGPPSTDLLRKLERALDLDAGALTRIAAWQQTPAPVREHVVKLESEQRMGQRLAEILASSGVDDAGQLGGALDRAYRSGELRRLVDRLAPETADADTPNRPDGDRAARDHADPDRPVDASGAPGRASHAAAARSSDPLRATLPREVPLINKVAAGYPREFTDLGYPARVADEYVRTPEIDDADAFAARVVGESMRPEYREGDIVVFSPAREIKSGMDCFARLEHDGETTFKRVYFERGPAGEELIRLQPLNPAYPPTVLPREHVAGLYAAVSVTRRIG